jgi:hypothetical protein
MPLVDQRTILRRMAAKDLRVNAAYAAARKKRVQLCIDNASCSTIDGNREGVSSTNAAPDSSSRASKEDA